MSVWGYRILINTHRHEGEAFTTTPPSRQQHSGYSCIDRYRWIHIRIDHRLISQACGDQYKRLQCNLLCAEQNRSVFTPPYTDHPHTCGNLSIFSQDWFIVMGFTCPPPESPQDAEPPHHQKCEANGRPGFLLLALCHTLGSCIANILAHNIMGISTTYSQKRSIGPSARTAMLLNTGKGAYHLWWISLFACNRLKKRSDTSHRFKKSFLGLMAP